MSSINSMVVLCIYNLSNGEGGTSVRFLVRILPAIGPVRIGGRGESYCFSIKVLVIYSFAKALYCC
jgi:hypothetical protein